MLLKQKSSINSSDIAGTWKDSKRRTASQRAQDCMEPNSAFHVYTVQTVPKILHIFAPAYLGGTKSTKFTKHICSYLFGKRHLNKIYRSYFLLHVHAVCAKPRLYHSYLFKLYFLQRTCLCWLAGNKLLSVYNQTGGSLLHSYYLHFTSPDGKASMLVIPTFYPLGGKASTSACSVVVWGQTTSMRRQSLSFDMVRHAITRFPSLHAPLTLPKQRNKPHARRFHIFHR